MSLNYHDPESYPKVENFNNVGEKNILGRFVPDVQKFRLTRNFPNAIDKETVDSYPGAFYLNRCLRVR